MTFYFVTEGKKRITEIEYYTRHCTSKTDLMVSKDDLPKTSNFVC